MVIVPVRAILSVESTDQFLGRVADFCLICRSIQPFRLYIRTHHAAVLLIPAGEALDGETIIQCECCGFFYGRERAYAGIVKEPLALDSLIEKTDPEIHSRFRERLRLEERIRMDALEPIEREEQIREPFLMLEPYAQAHSGGRDPDDGIRMMFIVAATVVVFLLAWVAIQHFGVPNKIGLISAVVILGIVLPKLYFMRDHEADSKRDATFAKLIARSLGPLKPTREELESELRSLSTDRAAIVRFVSADSLLKELTP